MSILCFHNPDEENRYLSNWIREISRQKQYSIQMMFHQKQLEREVLKHNDTYWNGVRQIIVYQGLIEKFSQNKDLQKRLLSTNTSVLAECAVKDRIWGIGLSMKDPNRLNMQKWKGQNLLEFTLMQIRDTLNTLLMTENKQAN